MKAGINPVATVARPFDDRPGFLERHYTVNELARSWHMAPATVRRWFENEPGVVRHGERRLRKGRKRGYVSLRIPETVVARVYRRQTGKLAEAQ